MRARTHAHDDALTVVRGVVQAGRGRRKTQKEGKERGKEAQDEEEEWT